MIGFTAVALIILCLVVSLCAFIQFSYGLYDINKMLMPASRAAAVCTSMEDAQKQAQLVAESESTDKNIENIKVSVEYADGYSKWESGTCAGGTGILHQPVQVPGCPGMGQTLCRLLLFQQPDGRLRYWGLWR